MILFEFCSVLSVLSDFVFKIVLMVKVDVKVFDYFDLVSCKVIIIEVNVLVSGSEDFDVWY